MFLQELEIMGGVYEVKATNGDTFLGGEGFLGTGVACTCIFTCAHGCVVRMGASRSSFGDITGPGTSGRSAPGARVVVTNMLNDLVAGHPQPTP